jgi:TIR domain
MAQPPRTAGRGNLYRADGSRRPDTEVLKESGNLGLRLALLDDAIHRRATSGAPDLQYPPRLFLSYKWGSEAENAWVAQLAQRLTRHGWDVVFDKWRDEVADRSVEEFVSRLVTCRVFVAVLSPAFTDSAIATKHASWVFDEMNGALLAHAHDQMRLVGIIPPAESVGPGVRSSPPPVRMPPRPDQLAIVVQAQMEPKFDELYEVRDTDDLERFLDRSLTYDGPRLDDAERGWIAERLSTASSEASLREILARYPFVSGVWRRLVVLLRDRGDLQSALKATQQALEQVLVSVERLMFEHEQIELLKRSGDRVGAARAATRLIDWRPLDWVAHFHLGDLLDDANELWAARSHLLLACRGTDSDAAPYNALGVVYMGLGLLARAEEELDHALRIDATFATARRNLEKVRAERATSSCPDVREVKGPLPGCSVCEAIFVPREDRPLTYAACGASRPAGIAPCDVCGGEGLSLTSFEGGGAAWRCPICRTGTVTTKGHASL